MRYCIVGGGRFGRLAARGFCEHDTDANIIIVDPDPAVCDIWRSEGYRTTCRKGEYYLAALLRPENPNPASLPDWIIPTAPIHLACAWIQLCKTDQYRLESIPIPAEIAAMLPNAMPGAGNGLYFSVADFRCPAKCPAPVDYCLHTGKPRLFLAYQQAERIQYRDYQSVVIYSEQLYPGIGGYAPSALQLAARKIFQASGGPVLLSTACRCHGVMHGFHVIDSSR